MSGPADFDNDLVDGIARLLAAASVATYKTSGTYASSDTGITMQILPPSPDNAIALSTYPISDDPTLSDSVIALQVFSRTAGNDPRTTNTLAGSVYNQLHGLSDVLLASGVKVVFCERRSGSLVGQDEQRRWERVDNYYLKVWRPSLNRI